MNTNIKFTEMNEKKEQATTIFRQGSYTSKDWERFEEEYTFLKRPFMINGESVFIGNAKKDVQDAKESFSK